MCLFMPLSIVFWIQSAQVCRLRKTVSCAAYGRHYLPFTKHRCARVIAVLICAPSKNLWCVAVGVEIRYCVDSSLAICREILDICCSSALPGRAAICERVQMVVACKIQYLVRGEMPISSKAAMLLPARERCELRMLLRGLNSYFRWRRRAFKKVSAMRSFCSRASRPCGVISSA